MTKKKFPTQSVAPSDTFPRASRTDLRVAVEKMDEGDWLDTRTEPSRQAVKTLCQMCRRIERDDGRSYIVRQDKQRHTIWVHCVDSNTHP